MQRLSEVVDEALESNHLDSSAIDWLVPHQANKRIIDGSAKKLGIPLEKVVVTVDLHGNTSAASIPLALFAGAMQVAVAMNAKSFKEAQSTLSFLMLLPMIPGMYAYKTVFSMIMFMQNLDDPSAAGYLAAIVRNGFVTFSVIFMLAAGAAAPIFLFNKRAHSLTRNKKQIRS